MCYHYSCVNHLFSTPTYPNPLWSSTGPVDSALRPNQLVTSLLSHPPRVAHSPLSQSQMPRNPDNAWPPVQPLIWHGYLRLQPIQRLLKIRKILGQVLAKRKLRKPDSGSQKLLTEIA